MTIHTVAATRLGADKRLLGPSALGVAPSPIWVAASCAITWLRRPGIIVLSMHLQIWLKQPGTRCDMLSVALYTAYVH